MCEHLLTSHSIPKEESMKTSNDFNGSHDSVNDGKNGSNDSKYNGNGYTKDCK